MTQESTVTVDAVTDWFEEEESTVPSDALDVAQVVTDPATKYAKNQLRVVRETRDYQLDYLQHALQPGRELIDISPAYQRRLRWPNKKKSLLIESFLMNIPVPPIFLFEKDYNEFEVIDGRQRLDAISSFLANDFALVGLEYWPELNRKRFRDLPLVLQRGLLRRSLSAVVLLAESRNDHDDGIDVRRALFDRLNTGGIQLNPQELRNALHPGRLNALLIRLARSDDFTSVWGIPPYAPGEEKEPSDALLKNPLFSSLADAELVLRFFALKDAIRKGRTGSLRAILDGYMEREQNLSSEEALRLEVMFLRSLLALREIFGTETFRLPSNRRLSRPLYDALMIALSDMDEGEVKSRAGSVRDALHRALQDDESYEVLVGRGNTIASVHERVDLAVELLKAGQ